jgi:hypothetical protein
MLSAMKDSSEKPGSLHLAVPVITAHGRPAILPVQHGKAHEKPPGEPDGFSSPV